MTFIRTTAIDKIRAMTKRKKVIPGGTSASKTYGILAVLIDAAARTDNLEISVVSESVPHLRRGALKDFLKIMKETYRYRDEAYNRTLLTYRFMNGSYIEFFSADQDEKVRGARRNILFINECNNLTFQIYHQLAVRTDQDIYLDFNPSNEFWVHSELIGDKDVETLTLTYKDNEALSKTIIDDIEQARDKGLHDPNGDLNDDANIKNSYWANWWKVYGCGLLGTLEGIVFDNWEIIKEVPSTARLLGNGLDFGYTNPSSIISLYKNNEIPIFDQLVYKSGLTNPDIFREYKSAGGNPRTKTKADSAEPKSIAELRSMNWNISACTKGKDSVNFGISLMKQEKFQVTERSLDFINELRTHMWDKDKSGNPFDPPRPVVGNDHAIAAARYISMEELSNKSSGSIVRATGYRRKGT